MGLKTKTTDKGQRAVECYFNNPSKENLQDAVVHYDRLVYSFAHGFRGQAEFEDLVAEGNFGLVVALQRWEPPTRFSTFAVPYVVGYMRHYLGRRHAHVRKPAWLYTFEAKERRAIEKLEQESGEAHADDIAKLIGMPVGTYLKHKAVNPPVQIVTLNQPKLHADAVQPMVPRGLHADIFGKQFDVEESDMRHQFLEKFGEFRGKSVLTIAHKLKCPMMTAREIYELLADD